MKPIVKVNGVTIKRTLCASCEYMWDGCGLTCPRKECSSETKKCDHYKRMSDKDLMTFAPRFWNESFIHHYVPDEEWEEGMDMWVDQPVRPLISEIQPIQLTINL